MAGEPYRTPGKKRPELPRPTGDDGLDGATYASRSTKRDARAQIDRLASADRAARMRAGLLLGAGALSTFLGAMVFGSRFTNRRLEGAFVLGLALLSSGAVSLLLGAGGEDGDPAAARARWIAIAAGVVGGLVGVALLAAR